MTEKRRTSFFWGTGLFLLIPVAGFLSLEIVQRQRFAALESEIAAALKDLEARAKPDLAGQSGTLLKLVEGSERPTGSFAFKSVPSGGRLTPSVQWYVVANMKYASAPRAAFAVRLRQERRFLLPRPRVTVLPYSVMHESVWTLIHAVLKEHRIDYVVAYERD